ncbi:GNAT family N-acetyltransferase [Actinopolymorpha sp. B17G11]|uniref:GNAT family N-acetyltransferase n=1 Tax=unclassified Actinopolymorpha TaxID=2627063 RepID=UPI0032D9418B
MRCETTSDPGEFWAAASEFLSADPVLNSVIITNVLGRRSGAVTDPAPATYLTVLDDTGAVVGAAMRTPPFAVTVSSLPPGAAELAVDALLAACPDASGVIGPSATATACATEWERRTDEIVTVRMQQRIYRLDVVRPPVQPTGSMRRATKADIDLIAAWGEAFHLEVEAGSVGAGPAEAGPAERHAVGPLSEEERALERRRAELRVGERRAYLWENGGEPVSYVGATNPAGGVVRVAPVYTPPDKRGRGYASALVAGVSQAALDAGATACSLYTDLANPTSNKIYAAVGYRPVCDVTNYRFGDR